MYLTKKLLEKAAELGVELSADKRWEGREKKMKNKTPKYQLANSLENYRLALSLIDGAKPIIEIYPLEGEYNKEWKKEWLRKARVLLNEYWNNKTKN